MATVIDGKAIAAGVRASVASDVADLVPSGIVPGLAVVLVGADPASQVYIRSKVKQALAAGRRSFEHRLPASTGQAELLALVAALNADDGIDGILVQLPLPAHIDADMVLDMIDPMKDVDGFHPVNVGRLSTGTGGLVPCTPLGCMLLLDSVVAQYHGLKAVVIGKSNIVGKPVAMLLLECECTVTVTHIATRGLPDIVRTADIVVAAAGSARRLGQTRRHRHRCRHQPRRARRRKQDRRRPGLRRDGSCRGRHSGAGRGGPYDDRLPPAEYRASRAPSQERPSDGRRRAGQDR